MSISPLLPLAASAGSTVAVEAASRIGAGLASFAEALASGGKSGDASAGDIEKARAAAETKLAEFYNEAAKALREAGVDLAFPVSLESDVRGQLRLHGAHHEQDAIRQVLADNPKLSAAFHALADQLRALEETAPGSQLRVKLSDAALEFKFA